MFPNQDTPSQKRKRLRQFGLLVGGIFALIGFWQLYRGHHETVRIVLWSLGGFLIGAGLIAPTILAPIYVAWMKLAFILGWVNSRILLSIIFFLLFTPIALVLRLLGRDALDRRIEKQATSYWRERQPIKSIQEHCERQY
ncbi:sxtJ [Candidatus Poribacteria bacterium]|nr:sxtJ [Candidatus Poribacteria bacterium]